MAENKTENPGTEEMEVRLAQLNQFTRRTLTQEEVFLFDVRLCDNEIDRDGERFSLEALEQLKTLFVGKTGIFDHNPKGENQTARLYAAELVQDPERITAAGEVYTFLKGHAYMVRTDANRDLIREIDGGIKKEVSISCAAASQTCSVCGSDRRHSPCSHRIGQRYGDKLCHVVLGDVTIGENSGIWYNAVVRGDRDSIVIGRESNIQDNAVVHLGSGYPVEIGDHVTIGHGAIVHGCKIGDNTMIGMGAILMNGCKIGKNCIIGAGALVTQNVEIPDNSLVVGNPGKVKRAVTEEEIRWNLENAQLYVDEAQEEIKRAFP